MLGTLSATLIVVAGAGCGSSERYDNADRPPAPVNVSISLTPGRIAVSPTTIGAGPVVLLIANESGRSRELTLTAPGAAGGCVDGDASSGPIHPQGTARVQLSLVEGACTVGVDDGRLPPARLAVGPERPSAQDDLLAP
jgi:hypothetical protein